MITSQNITAYISYLHQQRLGTYPNQELINKWAQLPDSEIDIQLKNLYSHWNLSERAAIIHEQNFLSFSNPKPVAIEDNYIETQQINDPIVRKQKSPLGSILAVLLIGAAVGLAIFLWSKEGNRQSAENTTNNAATPITQSSTTRSFVDTAAQSSIATPTVTMPSTSTSNGSITSNTATDTSQPSNTNVQTITQVDKENFKNLQSLFDAEIDQDFEKVYAHFSPAIKQYWQISYPTKDELQNNYTNNWTKIKEAQNTNLKVSKIGELKYRVTGDYEYYSIKSEAYKTAPINTIFEFDIDGKIVYENKAQ